jgi:hypothetical protein
VVGTALPPQPRRHRLIALAHHPATPGNVIMVHGDETCPDLGLPVDRCRALAWQVDAVVPARAKAVGCGPVPVRCGPTAAGWRGHPLDPPRRARWWP